MRIGRQKRFSKADLTDRLESEVTAYADWAAKSDSFLKKFLGLKLNLYQ